MTNTLHRFGSADSFHDDFIVFAMACKGPFKQENALDGLRRFLQIAIEFKPVNLGDARHGGAIRPSRQMNPLGALGARQRAGLPGSGRWPHRRDDLRGGLRQSRER
jgi:hypothetical protein